MYICYCLPKDFKKVREIINSDLLLRNTTKVVATQYCDNGYAYIVEVNYDQH